MRLYLRLSPFQLSYQAVHLYRRKGLTSYVNPFLGTATLWEPEDLGYVRTWEERTWGAEVFLDHHFRMQWFS